ncbi:MAG: molybdopterin molybdotransferase MoeA [Cyclobacteriaceae bacterium]
MITVEEANQIVLSNCIDFGIEEIPLFEAMGRILREPIVADRDFPPYDRVTMDGIAIRYEDFQKGQRQFEVKGMAVAGSPQQNFTESGICTEIMTGAILPTGLDTVIRYEDVEISDGLATINVDEIREKQNIHFKGEDRKQGDQILSPGKRLSSSEIGVCATVGKSTIKVSRLPKVIIISTGDELVEIDQQPLPHQIRRSNVYRLKTALENHQIKVETDHIDDDYEMLLERLARHLDTYDVVLLSGGVSMGKFDYLPKALEALGVMKLFHKIKQRPGKPFWLGRKDDTMVFAFPGNPVSSFMCSQRYFVPWLHASLKSDPTPEPIAVLTENVQFKPELTYFIVVKLSYSERGELLATPLPGHGSGDLANLVDGDAFLELPSERDEFKKGEAFRLIVYRS